MLILNKMYVGGYLTEGENIGHEVINLIKAKDDNYYIWLNAGGNIPEYQVKRMKGKNIDVLLARPAGKGIFKVLGLAKNCEIDNMAIGKKDKTEAYNEQKNVMYKIGNKTVSLGDIYKHNTYHNADDAKSLLYTFKCENVYMPVGDMYITNDEKQVNTLNSYINYFPIDSKESLREYKYDIDLDDISTLKNTKEKEKDLRYLDVNNGQWKKINQNNYFDNLKKEMINKKNNNIYQIIKKDKDEIVISNSLGGFLELTGSVDEFVTNISQVKSGKFELLREEFNVDLLFYNNEDVVIIENKIDSGLNGVIKSTDNKKVFCDQVKKVTTNYINRYRDDLDPTGKKDIIEKRSKKIMDLFKNDKSLIWSQLAKYYVFAINKLLDNDENKEIKKIQQHIHSFVLIPAYRRFEVLLSNKYIDKIDNVKYSFANNYKLIAYDKVYDIFVNLSKKSKIDKHDKLRLDDFVDTLNKLARPYDDALEKEIMYKLFNIVNS